MRSMRRQGLSQVPEGAPAVTPVTERGTAGEEGLRGSLSPPDTAGSASRYRLLDLVGTGGMGVVYRAEDVLLGRTVALKFLPPALTPDPRAKARFLDEARAVAALDHPNICTLYEIGETAEGQLFLAMAYYKGETLKQRLERGPLPVAEALNITLQVARGLAKAPEDRYPDAAVLLDDLSALERAATGMERTAASRRRLLAWVAVLMMVLAGGFWLFRNVRRSATVGPEPSQATVTRLTDLPGREWFPSLSPDGNFFVYARKVGERSRLFLQQVGGGTALDLLPNSFAGDSQPAISPDGHEIVFRSEREGGGIFLMGLMGESVRRVTGFGFNPAWSPDGKEILCATEGINTPLIRRHPSQIYRVDLVTGRRRLVHTGDAVQPSWSPNGLRIAYWGASPSGQRVIWNVPAEGGEAVQVTTGTSVDWNPVWSPDGRYLYFASDRSGVTNLWRLPLDERSGRVLGKPEPV